MLLPEGGAVARHHREIHAVVNAPNTGRRDEGADLHSMRIVIANTHDLIQRQVKRARRPSLPQRPSRWHVAFGLGALVGKEDLFHARKPRDPWVRTEESREIEVQNLRAMFSQDTAQR